METFDFPLLVWKSLKGEINPDEAAALADWLSQSAENQRVASLIREAWQEAGASELPFSVNVEADYAQVLSQIRQRPQGIVVPMRVVWRRRLLRAAAVLGLGLAAFFAYRQFAPAAVEMVLTSADKGQIEKIEMPDGSQVWLRQGAKLTFPKTFSVEKRQVQLDGEAFFSVAHNPVQPFTVDVSDGTRVEVLGTEFDVRGGAGVSTSEIFVKKGKVRFSHTASKSQVVLVENQKAVFNHESKKMHAATAETPNATAWQTGGLSFVNTPFSTVVADFQKFYNVKITLENEAMKTCPVTSPLINQTVEKALAALAVVYKLEVKKVSESEFVLKGGVCK